MCELQEVERRISVRIMQEDAESIYSVMKTEQDSVFSMQVLPYYALFVQEAQKFIEDEFLPETVSADIKDIRNHIKVYSERFTKSQEKIRKIDEKQDEDFKEQLRFDFLKLMNVHLNLGTYWTEDHHLIGNTQQLAESLSVENMFDPTLKEKFHEQGYHIGAFVNSIRGGLADSLGGISVERESKYIEIKYYCDINTNKKNELLTKVFPKEINLLFLHLLGNMNFVKHILKPLFKDDNTWTFRVEYVVSYYTLRALERLKNYHESNNEEFVDIESINELIAESKKIFNTKIRNCMMHYNLEGAEVIMVESIDKPFYGIIENCFNDMSYTEYLISLHDFSDKIIDYLENQFDFSEIRLERF